MTIKTLALCLLLLTGLDNAQGQSVQEDSTAIVKMEQTFLEAEFRLDTSTISQMMDSHFVAIGSWGVSHKHEELKSLYGNIELRLKEQHIVDSFYFDEVFVTVIDHTPICTFVVVTRGTMNGVPFSNRQTRFYDTWIRKNDQWRIAASQATRL